MAVSDTARVVLTSAEVAAFHAQGFLAVSRPLVSEDEITDLAVAVERVLSSPAAWASGDRFDLGGIDADPSRPRMPQVLNPARYEPGLDGPWSARVEAVVRQLFGEEARSWLGHLIVKPPLSPVETPWHQDEAYWEPAFQYHSLSLWMPLVDVDRDSGCLSYVPGSHEWPVLDHRPIGGDVRVHGLELVDLAPVRHPVACPLPAGGFVVHRNRTAHHAGPNGSATPRPALVFGGELPVGEYPVLRRFAWNETKRTARSRRAGGG